MNKYIYYVEGPCELQLINALKLTPSKLMPGKVKVYNVIQKLIPKSEMLGFKPDTTVVLVFDTDVHETKYLTKNMELLRKYCGRVQIVNLAQVYNLEDELMRCTDIKHIAELTQSKSISNFKTDFCKMKIDACRFMLDRHHINMNQLWNKPARNEFSFIIQNSDKIKLYI